MRLEDNVVPDDAAYSGNDLGQLNLTSRFGCSVIEVERNGYVITRTRPDLRIYPGDKLLLLGGETALAAAREFLHAREKGATDGADEFSGSILQTEILPEGPHAGKTLADLQIARSTGVRIAGIKRGMQRIINPNGDQIVEAGDNLLVVGTLNELRTFRHWLKGGTDAVSAAS